MGNGPARPEELLAHADFVRGLARSLLAGEDGADDVEQETWAAAVVRPPRDADAARSWLGTVVRNFVRQRRRAAARRRAREEIAARPERAPSAEEVLAREEQRRRVVEAVLALDPSRREVVLLRFYESLPPREIARRLGEPVETVRTRLKRALSALRERLDEGRGGDRRAWALLLVPFARETGRDGGGGIAGGLVMGAAAKAGTGIAAAALVAAAWWAWPRENTAPPVAPAPAGPPEEVAAVDSPARPVPAPSPVPGGPVFRGRASDAVTGEPIAGARVRAFDGESGDARSEATTDPAGAFSIPAGATERATLRLEAPGFEALERRGAAADAALSLRARRLCAVTVRVRDARGDPVSGAEAAIWSEGFLRGVALSDAEGRAVLADLPPGDHLLGVLPPPSRTDLAEASDRTGLSPGERREIPVTLEEGASCRGRVVDAETGSPLAGARITTVRGMRYRERIADAEGAFPYDHGPAGKANRGAIVLVSADGYETTDHRFRPAVDREFTVPLRRCVSHRFRVLAADGAPVPGARVIAYGTKRLPPVPVGEGVADAEGFCTVAGFSPEETHTFIIAASSPDGRSGAFLDLIEGTPGGLRAQEQREGAVALRLAPLDRTITIRVRRGSAPAEGLLVRTGWIPDGRESHFGGRRGAPPRRPVLPSLLPAGALREGDTAPDGTVRLDGLPRGSLSAEIDGHGARGWIASTRDGDATLEIDLEEGLPEKHEVRGVVRTKAGPVNGAFVNLLDAEGRMGDGSVTYGDGKFRIETHRGAPTGLRLSLPESGGAPYRTLDFPLPPAGEEADLVVE